MRARFALIETAMAQQDRNKALVICQEVLTDPGARTFRAEAYYRKGLVHKADKKFAEARQAFESARSAQPEDRYAVLSSIELAVLTAEDGKLEEALGLLREIASTRVDAVGAEAQFHIGELLMHEHRYDEAREALLRVGYVYTDAGLWHASALLRLGRISEAEAKTEEAKQYYGKVLEQYGGSEQAREARTRLEILE